jgi:hypothetical protein
MAAGPREGKSGGEEKRETCPASKVDRKGLRDWRQKGPERLSTD